MLERRARLAGTLGPEKRLDVVTGRRPEMRGVSLVPQTPQKIGDRPAMVRAGRGRESPNLLQVGRVGIDALSDAGHARRRVLRQLGSGCTARDTGPGDRGRPVGPKRPGAFCRAGPSLGAAREQLLPALRCGCSTRSAASDCSSSSRLQLAAPLVVGLAKNAPVWVPHGPHQESRADH